MADKRERATFFDAIKNGNTAILSAIASKYPDAPSWTDSSRKTALRVAIDNNNLPSFRQLLALGADVNQPVRSRFFSSAELPVASYAVLRNKPAFLVAAIEYGADLSLTGSWSSMDGYIDSWTARRIAHTFVGDLLPIIDDAPRLRASFIARQPKPPKKPKGPTP